MATVGTSTVCLGAARQYPGGNDFTATIGCMDRYPYSAQYQIGKCDDTVLSSK